MTAPTAATTGSMARRAEWSAPPGSIASRTSCITKASANAIPTSLTRNESACENRKYPTPSTLAETMAAGRGERNDEVVLKDESQRAGHDFPSLVMAPLTTMCPVREAADQRAMARGTAGCAGPAPAPVRSMRPSISSRSSGVSSSEAAATHPSTCAGVRAPTIATDTLGQASTHAMATAETVVP